MLLTDLADVCRTSGLHVVEVAGWQRRTASRFGMAEVRAIFLHHTAGPSTGLYPSLRTVRDGRPGIPGPLSQLGLARDGSVWVIGAGRANHPGRGSGYGMPTNNAAKYSIGIEAESTGRGDWTPAQIDAYPRLVAALCRGYGVPVHQVIGHKEWAPTRKIDPYGWPGDVDGFRATVAALLGASLVSNGGITAPTFALPSLAGDTPVPLTRLARLARHSSTTTPEDDMTAFVQALYAYYLGRAGSPLEWAGWIDQAVDQDLSFKTLAERIAGSREALLYATRHAYATELGRAPSSAELKSWADKKLPFEEYARRIGASPEAAQFRKLPAEEQARRTAAHGRYAA